MVTPPLHSASASSQEICPLSITSKQLWASTRSIQEPSSPSTLSAVSEVPSASDISNLEIISSNPSNSSTAPLLSYTVPSTTSNPSPDISDPSTHLLLPQLPIATVPTMNIPHLYPLAQMPVRGEKKAPSTFKGEYWKVARIIDHYTHLLKLHQVVTDEDKCKGIIEYCSQTVEDFITSCPSYMELDWNALREDILKYYDAERMESRIQPNDFYTYLNKQTKKRITTLSQWKQYNRKYLSYAGFLKRNGQLDDIAYHGYFWYGIPEDLRQLFEVKLQAKNPAFDDSDPWPITLVQEVAEVHFKRNKFTDKLFHLPALGIGRRYEEEDDEDSEDEYESEDEDYEEERRKQKKKSAKKKAKSWDKPFRKLPTTQVMKEESSRKIVPPPEDGGIENIIQQLNTMSLEDPRYGALYYKAVKNDRSGFVAQCINKKPQYSSSNRLPRESPSYQSQPPVRPPYSRGILLQMPGQVNSNPISKCYGCAESGHPLRHCPKMANMVYKGLVSLDANLKYRLPDGRFITRLPEESLIEAIERLTPSRNQVQFATLGNSVAHYYNKPAKRKRYLYEDDSEEEESEEESNEESYDEYESEESDDEFEEAHWKWKAQRRQKYPTYMAYE